jgi:hypothetical protein
MDELKVVGKMQYKIEHSYYDHERIWQSRETIPNIKIKIDSMLLGQ